jgi:hypothetical protein
MSGPTMKWSLGQIFFVIFLTFERDIAFFGGNLVKNKNKNKKSTHPNSQFKTASPKGICVW